MQLYIPEIGEEIELTEQWRFRLFNESRNTALIKATGNDNDPNLIKMHETWVNATWEERNKMDYDREGWSWPVSLPAGSILKIARVYIRVGISEYSSITFTVDGKSAQLGIKTKPRFWAKLDDVNKIQFKKVQP